MTVIEKEVKTILENYGVTTKQLQHNASFINDLGLDSLDFTELVLIVEQIFDICISIENDNLDTIGDLVNTIEDKLKKNSLKC